MFVTVGRFTFRPMQPDERRELLLRIEEDVPPVAQASRGFRGLQCVAPSDDEVMMVWLWDTAADWEAALPQFMPALQEYVIPNLAQPPDRVGGEAAFVVSP